MPVTVRRRRTLSGTMMTVGMITRGERRGALESEVGHDHEHRHDLGVVIAVMLCIPDRCAITLASQAAALVCRSAVPSPGTKTMRQLLGPS